MSKIKQFGNFLEPNLATKIWKQKLNSEFLLMVQTMFIDRYHSRENLVHTQLDLWRLITLNGQGNLPTWPTLAVDACYFPIWIHFYSFQKVFKMVMSKTCSCFWKKHVSVVKVAKKPFNNKFKLKPKSKSCS